MQIHTRNKAITPQADISLVIQTVLLNFKTVSRHLKNKGMNGRKFSVLSLYVLLCLYNSRPLLRNDFMKRLGINYYDAGKALDILQLYGLITFSVSVENSNIKTLCVTRKRYRLSLSGEIFVNELLQKIKA